MKEKENKHCIVCGKLLVLNQKNYCSKDCEVKDRKGKKVGPYNKDRVDAMAKGKRLAYEEKYLNSYKPLIEEYLSYNYINNIPQLANHINMPVINLTKYFKYYPDKHNLLKNTPKYPKEIQDYSPEKFLEFKQKLLNLNIDIPSITNLASEYNISVYAVLKSLIAVRPNLYNKIIYFKGLGSNTAKNLRKNKYSSIEEKLENSPSNLYKYSQVKKLFERDHVDDLFRKTLFFRERAEYKNYLIEVSSRYNCQWKLLVRFLKEKGIKPDINYNVLITRENICNRLKMSWEELSMLLDNLRKESSYIDLYYKYRELYNNSYIDIYKNNYKYPNIYNFVRDMEVADTTGYLISLKKKFYEENDGANVYLLLKLGLEGYEEFLNDVKNLKTLEDFSFYISKHKNILKCDNCSYRNLVTSLNPNYRKLSDAYFKNTLSKDGGSSIEKKVIDFLKSEGINFETQVPLKGDKKYSIYHIDLLINGAKVVEIQGDYWHGNPCFYYLDNKQLRIAENSIFPGFIYENTSFHERKKLNEKQIKTIDKDFFKKEKMREVFGEDNLYYIWEYDIRNNFEEVKKFLRSLA